MATPPQLTQLAFAAGIDESIEPETMDPTHAFPVLENGRQDHRGGYRKRLGYSALSTSVLSAWGTSRATSTRTEGVRMGVSGDRAFVIGNGELSLYDEASSMSLSLGRVPDAKVSARAAASTWSGNVLSNVVDMVVCNGIRAIASISWDPATGNYEARVGLETEDGLMLRPHETIGLSPGTPYPSVQLGFAGTNIYVIAGSFGGANIRAEYISAASVSAATATGWTFITNVATDRATTGNGAYQLCSQSLTDRVAFAYVNGSGGTSQVTVTTFNTSGVLETATVNTSSVTPDIIGTEGSIADTLWVAWNEGTSVKMKGLTGNSLATVKATTGTLITTFDGAIPALFVEPVSIGIVSDPSTAGAGRLVVTDLTLRNAVLGKFTTVAGATTFGSAGKVYGAQMAARPFAVLSRFYGVFQAYGGTGYTVVCDITDAISTGILRPIANVFPALGQLVGFHPIVGTTTAEFCMSAKRSASAATPEIVSLDFAAIDRWRTNSDGPSAIISGGVLSYVDDSSVPEVAFMHPPSIAMTSVATAGLLTGDFRYVATYEHVDSNGDWNISAVSAPLLVSGIATKKVALEMSPLSITNRLDSSSDPTVRVVIYRTGGTTAQPPYYYVTDVANNTGSFRTYTDNTVDVSANRLLLGSGNLPGTNGSVQDRRAPPFADHVVEYNGMIVISSGTDLYWSGAPLAGEGRWFTPAFTEPVPVPAITALAAMDGTLYVFGERIIFSIAGEAPTDNGAQGGLGSPRRLAVSVGSVDGRVCVTELGCFFRSKRGVELLGRSGSVEWIGEPVEETLADFPNVTSIVLDDRNSLVRVSLTSGVSGGLATGDGRDLIYDLTLQTWVSRDEKTGVVGSEASQDACVISIDDEKRYAWLGADGTVHYEKLPTDASAYLDGSTWITRAAETAGFKTSGIQGQQQLNRVLALLRYASDHDLKISIAYNHETSFRTARTFTAAEISALLAAGWPITQLEHEAHDDALCQEVRIRLEDATPSSGTVGTGEGGTWLALTLDITPKPGAFEVPEGAR